MHLIFQNPAWFFVALAVVPLLAHLFSRTRPRRRDYPSLRLLREAMRRITRIRKPRDRWLLLLRTLAMLALALAFLQPWLMSRFAVGANDARTLVLVVDISASMAFADGTRTRLAQATAAGEELLGTLSSGSRANIVWVQAHAASALPEPGPNIDFLRQALRRASARPEAGDIAGALQLALQQLGAASGPRELVVISDFQKSAWRATSWEMPATIRLMRLAVGRDAGTNVALAGLAVEPARPVAGQEAQLVCRVRNFSGAPHRATLFAEAGESRLSQAVDVAPWSETLALLPVKFPQEGLVPLKAALAEDRFPGDDVRHGIAVVRGALQVGVVGLADDPTAAVWTRAAQALDGVAVRRLGAGQIAQAGSLDLLFVAGWDGRNAEELRGHLERGGALVIQPAAGFVSGPMREWLGAGGPPDQPLAQEVKDAPGWALRIANEEHPVFALFASGAFGDPANARFRRRLSTPSFLTGKPLLSFEDNRPALALIETRASAAFPETRQIAWWNLDLGASDWPTRTAFLPFFGEFLRHLAQRTGAPVLRVVEAGETLRFDAPTAVDPADVRLVDAHDQRVATAAESPRTPGSLVTVNAAVPGSYRWMAQGGLLDRAVVNFPETESDLRQLSAAELDPGPNALIHDAARAGLAELRKGRPLWPWCVAAASLFLLAEAILLSRQRAIPQAVTAPGKSPATRAPESTLTSV